MKKITADLGVSYIKIIVFLALTLFFSSMFWLFSPTGSFPDSHSNYVAGFMWSPGFAAIVTSWIFGGKLLLATFRPAGRKFFLAAVALPFTYCLVAYVIVWCTGLGEFPNPKTIAYIKSSYGWTYMNDYLVMILYVLFTGMFGTLRAFMLTMGEEIGWRGLLVTELFKVSNFYVTSLISGIVWALWHYPAIMYGGYNTGLPTWISLVNFTVMIIGMSFILTWLRLRSGSLLPVALFHAVHNVVIQGIFTPYTGNMEHANFYIDEFGILIPLCIVVMLIFFRKEFKQLNERRVYHTSYE